jgi:hypothetical protein
MAYQWIKALKKSPIAAWFVLWETVTGNSGKS